MSSKLLRRISCVKDNIEQVNLKKDNVKKENFREGQYFLKVNAFFKL